MFCNLFQAIYDIVCLLVHVFLAEAKNHIAKKEHFNDLIKYNIVHLRGYSKGCVICIPENIVTGSYHHY